MFYINILVVLLYGFLAILSRKHFSKYKDGESDFLRRFFLSLGQTVYEHVKRYINHDRLGKRLRKLTVISDCSIDKVIRTFVVKMIACSLGICFVANLLSFCVCCYNRFYGSTNSNSIERENYDGDIRVQEILLNGDGREDVYLLNIAPVEYEEKQFEEEAKIQFSNLEEIILGENPDASNIYENLFFPTSVNGCFVVEWKSQNPEILSSSGKVYNDDLTEDMNVCVQAIIKYNDMSLEHTYSFIIKGLIEEDRTKEELIEESLSTLEKETRKEKNFILPDEILGTKITVKDSNGNLPIKILILGVLFALFFVIYQKNNIISKGKERDDMLISIYPHFVNRLWLLIGAGMTTKSGLKQIVRESDSNDLLTKELEYTLNQIDAGAEETKCYEQLVTRLGLTIYKNLFDQLSQNLVIGSRDILRVMEDEVAKSMDIRKEVIRKKGEKASTKLLFPMALMLAVVLVIMIVPAFYDLGGF